MFPFKKATCTRVSSDTGSPLAAPPTAQPGHSVGFTTGRSRLTVRRDTALRVRFTFCSHHIKNTGCLFPHQERMRTTRRRQMTEDASAPKCGRRKLDSIWTTRWGRHKSGTRRGDQPNEPLERPANKGTRYQTHVRGKHPIRSSIFITDHSHEDGSVNGEEHVLQSSSEQNSTTKGECFKSEALWLNSNTSQEDLSLQCPTAKTRVAPSSMLDFYPSQTPQTSKLDEKLCVNSWNVAAPPGNTVC